MRLWWAVIRQAARDTLCGHESRAWDAAEFLATTGVWLCTEYFGTSSVRARIEVVRLMRRSRALKNKVVEVQRGLLRT